jgi:hypothetical protein
MTEAIVYTRKPVTIPGYEETPYGDGCFYHDPRRATQAQVNKLVELYEDSDVTNTNLDRIKSRCDFGGKSIDSDLSETDKS